MAWTGFGGSWSGGVHSGGDNSGSIGGGNIRSPNAANIAAQYNSYGGQKITASHVSNIRSDGLGGYSADIRGAWNTVSSGSSSHTSTTLGAFSGMLTSVNAGHDNMRHQTRKSSAVPVNKWNVNPESWRKLPDGYDTTVDGFKYHVTLDLNGEAISVKQTAPRPYTKPENLKVGKAKYGNKKPGDLYPELDFSKGEPERQSKARKEAEAAWKMLPPNIRSIDITVEGFVYSVKLNNYGNVISTVKIKDRPYTKPENLKVGIAKYGNKKPGDLYPDLDFSKGDPQRKSQAEKNAQDMFSSFPTNPISIASDFYKSLTDKFGDRLSAKAKLLAEEAKGKKIRSAPEAIAAFDKYKSVLNKKFSIADRVAIAKALESLDKQMMAAQLKKFGKMFGIIGESLQWGQFVAGIAKGFRTGEWNDAIIGGEKIAVGKIVSLAVVVAFSSIAVAPIGIIGFSLIMTITSALISDSALKDMNNFILSI